MWRHLLAVAVVVAVGGAAAGQGKEDPRKDEERKLKEQHEKWKEEWKGYFKNTSELPDLAAKVNKWGTLPTVEVGKDDPPAVRAAKRAMNAEAERFRLISRRIEAGSYYGGSPYTQLTECVFGQYAAAALLYDTPDKLLPFAEAAVVSLMGAEDFNFMRVKQGLEEPQLLPQLLAARCRAEVTVLKLREEIEARKPKFAPSELIAPPPVVIGPPVVCVQPLVVCPPVVVLPTACPCHRGLFGRRR